MCQQHFTGGGWEHDECHCFREFSSSIFSDGFNDFTYEKLIQEALKPENITVKVYGTYFFLKQKILSFSGFLWIREVPSLANRCDKIPVCSPVYTKPSRHFYFLKIICMGKNMHM